MSRVAVVLFNLGGPDGPEAVRPFLYNLFKDPAIISVPALLRYPIAALISSRREASAQANYNIMGGASPLLPETRNGSAHKLAAIGLHQPCEHQFGQGHFPDILVQQRVIRLLPILAVPVLNGRDLATQELCAIRRGKGARHADQGLTPGVVDPPAGTFADQVNVVAGAGGGDGGQ